MLLGVTSLLLAGCRKRELKNYSIDGDAALIHVQELVDIGPRPAGSEGMERTVDYLVGKVEALGLQPIKDTWTETTLYGDVTFRNLYVEVPGDGRPVVLGSHTDTKSLLGLPGFIGANDSASSTGLLLEIMATITENGDWDGPPVIFAFFDGEECVEGYEEGDGLHGSKRMVKWLSEENRLQELRAMILLDMIGDADLTLTVPQDTDKGLQKLLFETAREQKVGSYLKMYRGNILDDHVPFQDAGIPVVDLIDFEFGPDNCYWHTGADTMDKLSADSLAVVGNLTVRMLQKLADK